MNLSRNRVFTELTGEVMVCFVDHTSHVIGHTLKRAAETEGWSQVLETTEAREMEVISPKASGKSRPANPSLWVSALLNWEKNHIRDHLFRPKAQMYVPKDPPQLLDVHLFP